MAGVYEMRFGPWVLCQDCLRIAEFTTAKHEEAEFCPCGGQWCGCPACNDAAANLIAGERRGERIGTKQDVTFWCAETGIREE